MDSFKVTLLANGNVQNDPIRGPYFPGAGVAFSHMGSPDDVRVWHQDRPRFHCPRVGHLFRDNAEPTGFSLQPQRSIAELLGKSFIEQGVPLHIGPAEDNSSPYSSRMLKLSRAVGENDFQLAHGDGNDIPRTASLLMNPLQESRDEDAVKLLTTALNTGLIPTCCVLLPPARVTWANSSYYEVGLAHERIAFLHETFGDSRSLFEPLAVTLCRMAEAPLIRDFIADGAELVPLAKPNSPTKIAISFPATRNSIAEYRKRFFFDEIENEDNMPLSGLVRRQLRIDLAEQLHYSIEPAPQPCDGVQRDLVAKQNRCVLAATTSQGVFTYLQTLSEQRPQFGEKFDTLVIQPAKSLHEFGWNPHMLAFELFQANFWRCPASLTEPQRAGWHFALRRILWALVGLTGVNTSTWYSGDHGPEKLFPDVFVRHRDRVYEHIPMQADWWWGWIFLLPLGSILRCNNHIRLNDSRTRLGRHTLR